MIPDTTQTTLHSVRNSDGLTIRALSYGQANGQRPVICLAGLTRNGRDFAPLAEDLAKAGRQVITIDTRGRGLSDRDPDPSRYNLVMEMADVQEMLAHLGIARADFIGTSRGGLILHLLAMTAPDLLGSVIFNDIGPELALAGLRHIQAYLKGPRRPKNRAEIRADLIRIHAARFPLLDDADFDGMVTALYREGSQGFEPDFDQAIADQMAMLDFSKPLPDLWPQFDLLADKDVMVIRGEYSDLLTSETVTEMERRHPGLVRVIARGQGHAPLLHKPDCLAAIRTFLKV